MSVKSTTDRYGSIAVSIHWLSAILVLVLIVLGFRAAGTVDPAAKAAILRLHLPIGIAVLALTALRIVWWWRFDRKPSPVAGSPHWQERAAQAVHVLFYAVIFGMIASGISMMVLSGASPVIFGGQGAALPDFWKYSPRGLHGIGAWLLIALVVLHAGAALYHQFGRRDRLLRRMRFGK
jgi:cytochrome b561